MKFPKYLLTLLLFLFVQLDAATFLKDRLQSSRDGDYIVTRIDNTYTVLLIKERSEHQISIEEISIPVQRLHDKRFPWAGWKHWVENGANGHTSWLLYTIHVDSGMMREYFSYTSEQWHSMSDVNNFLSTLLNLRFVKIPRENMKRVGVVPPSEKYGQDSRRIWTPKLVYEGETIYGAEFEAWRTRWPRDCSELSGKTITVYLPEDEKKYPTYFPYWLEIQGMLGKAKISIVDSGHRMRSPRSAPPRKVH
ncbi:putative uncharacterized protein [Waddlia chondrophila 2032/99]|uniref:Uncharacterized protein n=2 Tax=Waddlia chondrophila TaxID=71667 RepID=D6YUU4_WADCW|nr:hypothetical protein [Waddlia chondrophila]ADI37905.1 conserved hypothetical protein [Waddlia chondrophila WSU 86-1044]CCB91279.1 putative uncharacterized protein [Waddlia chondrophila 2032/99]